MIREAIEALAIFALWAFGARLAERAAERRARRDSRRELIQWLDQRQRNRACVNRDRSMPPHPPWG